MSEEIKEILNKLLEYFKKSNINDFGYEKDKLISYEEAQIILDYITNLQEELEEEKRIEQADFKIIQNLEEENERLLKTQKMYEKKCNKIHDYILQNCEIIRHKDYDEVGKVNGGHILFLLNGGDEE